MTQTETMNFAFRFHGKFVPAQVEIIRYLSEHGGEFHGSYREFARALGKDKERATAVCKTVHSLQSEGIVMAIVDDDVPKKYMKTHFQLNPDWTELV